MSSIFSVRKILHSLVLLVSHSLNSINKASITTHGDQVVEELQFVKIKTWKLRNLENFPKIVYLWEGRRERK